MANDAGQRTESAPSGTKTVTKTTTPVAPKPVKTVVTNKTGQIAKVATPKAPVAGTGPTSKTDLNHYLGTDTQYQQTLAGLQKSLATFLAGQTQGQDLENTNYANSIHQLGQQEDVAQKGELDQFAGRGIAHSTIYGNALQDLNTGFVNKQTNADNAHAQAVSKFTQGKASFLDQQIAAKQAAMSAAAARRAAAIAAGG